MLKTGFERVKGRTLHLMEGGAEPARRTARDFGAFFRWVLLGCAVGAVAGGAGTVFYFTMRAVTGLRVSHGWLIWLLPIGGLFIVFLYRACRVTKSQGTNLVIVSVRSPEPVPLKMAPLIFVSTAVTHLFGGSAGREGAALQLGGSLGYQMGKAFRLDEKDLHIMTMCGMAASFSALFGTPATSAVFVLEVVTVGVMYYAALVPCAVASIVGYCVARQFGAVPTSFSITGVPSAAPVPFLRVALLAALCALVSILFCVAMHGAGSVYGKYVPNQYLRAAVGGALVVLLSLAFGKNYLGMGGDVIARSFAGSARPEAFLLKILFTAVTLGAGFRGGEIVPAMFAGSAFGCAMGGALGLDPSFGAAIGFLSVFCGVTNCPLTSFVLSMEVFGGKGAVYYLLAAGVSYMLSGYTGIYTKQRILYAKDKAVYIGGDGR